MSAFPLSIALGIICHDRADALAEAIASVDRDRYDQLIVVDMASDPPLRPIDGIEWVRSNENLGVAGGRNLVAHLATTDLIVFLDDDAIFVSSAVSRSKVRFTDDRSLAAVGFRVIRSDGRERSAELPFRGHPKVDSPREATYFVGCGHVIRRVAMQEVGGYDDRFFYDGEETDLSFALLSAGHRIWFDPAIVVEHRPESRGRVPAGRVAALTLRNRILIVRRHLPVPVAILHVLVWGLRTGRMAVRSRDIGPWITAVPDAFRMPVERRPMKYRALLRIHRLGGRVFW